jgi:hypothetical protein
VSIGSGGGSGGCNVRSGRPNLFGKPFLPEQYSPMSDCLLRGTHFLAEQALS